MNTENFQNGNIIKTKVNPLIYHYGIFFRDAYGNPKVMHNTIADSVVIDTLEVFFEDREFISVEKSAISGISYSEIIKRFNKAKHKEFNLLTYNCEDFVNDITKSEMKTDQIKIFTSIAALVALVFLIVSNYN